MVQSSDPGRPADRVPPDNLATRGWDPGGAPGLPADPLDLYGGVRPPPPIKPFQLSAVLRYRKTILLVLLLVAVPTILAIWLFTVPHYRSTAQVHVRPIIPRLVFDREGGPIPLYQSYFNTQVAIIRSPTVLQRALDQKDVQETQWYRQPPQPLIGSPLSPMERLSKDLRVDPRGMTEVIDISLSSPVAKDAAVIVNAVLDQYIRTVRESSSRMEDTLYNELLDRFNSYRTDIEGRQTTVDRLRKDLGTANPDELVGQQRMRIDALQASLADLDREAAVAERQRQDLAALIGDDAAAAPSSQPGDTAGRYDNDPDWLRLYIESRKAQLELEVQQSRLGDAHPMIMRLQKQAELVDTLLRERELQIDEQRQMLPGSAVTDYASQSLRPSPRQVLDNLGNQIRMMQYKRELLAAQLANEQKRFNEIFDSARTLAKENEQIQFQRQIFEAVRTRLTEKEMERNVPGSIESLARAYAASEPYHDRRVLYSVLAVLAGLGAGFGTAMLRVTFTEQIHEARDLPPPSVSPALLGYLPLLPRTDGGEDIEEYPILGESVRMVRTALLERLQGQRGQSVLITSSSSAEGKTTFASLLARSLAQCGTNVLLIDADLRKAGRTGSKDDSAAPGLAAALLGEAPEADVIARTDVPRLSVVAAGDVTRVELETLADGRFAALLEKWKQRFDLVLLDSPPVLPVADARILARQVDGTILVIREGTSRRPDVLEALACLRTAGAEVIGTVFISSTGRESYEASYYSYNGRRMPRSLAAGGTKAT